MNTSLQNILARSGALHVASHATSTARAKASAKGAQAASGSATASTDFQSVLQASTSAAIVSSSTAIETIPAATDKVARLGPFSAGAIGKSAQQAIADPAPLPTASFTALPASQQTLLGQAWDPFNTAQHEAKMNNWYMQTTQASNQQKVTLYQKAVADWKENTAHCQDLGIAVPPAPQVPTLTAVGPMPDGYWFGKNA